MVVADALAGVNWAHLVRRSAPQPHLQLPMAPYSACCAAAARSSTPDCCCCRAQALAVALPLSGGIGGSIATASQIKTW